MKNEVSRSYNLDELKAMSNGDKKFINDMIVVFIKSTDEGIKRIETAVKEKNYKVIGGEIHKIAPPCRHMGTVELYDVLKKVESNVHNAGPANELEELTRQARQKMDIVIKDLK